MTAARILVADPLHMFRAGVRNHLKTTTDFEVLEAATVAETFAKVEEWRPRIVLADLALPSLGGMEVARQLAAASETAVILWSETLRRDAVADALRAGAAGYLAKDISPSGLTRALTGALAGEAALSRDLTVALIDALRHRTARNRPDVASLSDRECQVLELISVGARNADVARELTISEFTVKRHVQNILQKLQLPSRRQAALAYREAQLSPTGTPQALTVVGS